MNITLTEADFARLVRGEVVEHEGVRIILADIGWDRMQGIIALAKQDARIARG